MAEEKAITTRAKELSREELRYGKGTVAEPAKGPMAGETQGVSHEEEMGARHGKEMTEMHGRHGSEMEAMHKRHASEHKDMMKRHGVERVGNFGGGTSGGGGPMMNTKTPGGTHKADDAPGEKKAEKKVESADRSSKDDAQKGKKEGSGKAA